LPSSTFNPPSSFEKLVEPEVVATSPCPGKSRVPVCCGFDSVRSVKSEVRGKRCEVDLQTSAFFPRTSHFKRDIPGRSLPPAHCLRATEGRSIYFALGDVKWYARPVMLRNPALIQCDAGHKAACGRVLTPLFELRAHWWPPAKAGGMPWSRASQALQVGCPSGKVRFATSNAPLA